MAFNPFNVFRRNQKILFSILTIVVMFMFVLSFGQGDFFDWLPRWLGSKKKTGEVMAVVDGDKVYQSELGQLGRKRTIANRYMMEAGAKASANLAKYVSEGTPRVSSENREIVRQALQVHQFLTTVLARSQMTPEMLAQIEPLIGLRAVQDGLANIVNAKNPKENDLDIAKVAQTLLNLDMQMATGRRGHYFANQPNANNRDMMNFVLWKKKAEALGISFLEKDINALVNEEFSNKVTADELKEIRDGMKGSIAGYTPEMLTEALAEEYKVRAAQEAVMGRAVVRSSSRGYSSPYDYYQFYKDQCSTARYGMISVPADNYLDKVTGTPTDSEIQEIFRKHRNDEPNPALARPGLKEPRKLKLEWVEVTGSEPHYKAAADSVYPQGDAFAVMAPYLALSSSLGGVTTAGLLATPVSVAGQDLFIKSKYEEYKRDQQSAARSSWFSPSVFGPQKPLDSSVMQPTNLTALAGIIGGAYASGGSPFAAPAALVGTAYAADRKARLLALQPALLAPVNLSLGGFGHGIALSVALNAAVQPLPLNAVKPALVEKAKEDLARHLASADFTSLQETLGKLKVEKNNSIKAEEARAVIDGFVKARGLKRGESAEFRDVFTVATDPGLAPLKDRQDSANIFQSTFSDPLQFGQRFFTEQDPQTGQPTPSTLLYRIQPFPQGSFLGAPSKGESAFAVWRSAELPAEAPRDPNNPAVRAKAIAAWKRQKARELAKQAADDLAKKCTGLGKNFIEIEPKLRDIRAQFANQFSGAAGANVRYFEVDDVAPLVSRPLPTASRNAPTAPFQLTPSFNIPHPSAKMTEDLLAGRDKAPSTTTVMADAPEDIYYVATLLGRDDRSADEFGLMVYGPFASFGGDLAPTISRRHQDEVRKQTYDTAIALLKAEFKYEKEHEDVNKKTEAGDEF